VKSTFVQWVGDGYYAGKPITNGWELEVIYVHLRASTLYDAAKEAEKRGLLFPVWLDKDELARFDDIIG